MVESRPILVCLIGIMSAPFSTGKTRRVNSLRIY